MSQRLFLVPRISNIRFPDLFSKDPNFNLSISELRTLLERFANGISMNIIFDAANVLIDDSRRDPALSEWFKDVDLYIRKVRCSPFILPKF